jgi:site-specific DNA-methyltransferase (adenine-specific)
MMIELNKIYNEDCLDTMKRMPDNFIDLTVTSPPYDNLRDYKGCEWNFDIFKSIACELYRVTKAGGAVVWVVGDATINGSETGTSFKQALYFKEIGFNLHDTMIYRKKGLAFPDTVRYYQCFEYMFILSKTKPKAINLIDDKINIWSESKIKGKFRDPNGDLKERSGYRKKSKVKPKGVRWNVWEYNTGWGHTYMEDYMRGHPAIFPEKLARDHIASWSNKGDLIYDPFMGSGTTALACIKLGRNYIGSEISKEYCEIANKRIKTELSQMKLF